ncbi:MAG: helix-turn-helix domain-containing protein [Bacteroidaceae bacterium]|nr:helix-turn-helix domain-containing protein [Bacteroidaceae bacterium]
MSTLDKITKLLKDRNIEQQELAEYLEISPTTICDWKNGKSHSYKKHIAKIAAFFNIPVELLCSDAKISENEHVDTTSSDLLIAFNKLSLADKTKVLNLMLELENQS